MTPYTKYHNKKTVIDGITFDSKREAARYQELKLLETAGEIQDLVLQPSFELRVDGGKVVGKYYADFKYRIGARVVIEDSKGVRTDVYRLKKKIVEAVHNIKITEV
jgi:dsDNA-binding SOS-regulon protein